MILGFTVFQLSVRNGYMKKYMEKPGKIVEAKDYKKSTLFMPICVAKQLHQRKREK